MTIEDVPEEDQEMIKNRTYNTIPSKPETPFLEPEEGMKWKELTELSDEFENGLGKWDKDDEPAWRGRAPSYFEEKNVSIKFDSAVNKHALFLKSEKSTDPPSDLPSDFDEYGTLYATSFVKTKETALYGYFEIYCVLMDCNISSAFWFGNPYLDEVQTELDVFEYSTSEDKKPSADRHFKNMFNTNGHVFKRNSQVLSPPDSSPIHYDTGFNMSQRIMKFGFNWQKDKLEWYINDVLVRCQKNNGFYNKLYLQLDSEAFENWFGLPSSSQLPSEFKIYCVRSWQLVPETKKLDLGLQRYYIDKYALKMPPITIKHITNTMTETDTKKQKDTTYNEEETYKTDSLDQEC